MIRLEDDVSVGNPVIKMLTAWAAAFGISSWGDLAAIFAAFYSFLLITEWFYRRFWRDMFVRWGWMQPVMRRRSDQATGQQERLV